MRRACGKGEVYQIPLHDREVEPRRRIYPGHDDSGIDRSQRSLPLFATTVNIVIFPSLDRRRIAAAMMLNFDLASKSSASQSRSVSVRPSRGIPLPLTSRGEKGNEKRPPLTRGTHVLMETLATPKIPCRSIHVNFNLDKDLSTRSFFV